MQYSRQRETLTMSPTKAAETRYLLEHNSVDPRLVGNKSKQDSSNTWCGSDALN